MNVKTLGTAVAMAAALAAAAGCNRPGAANETNATASAAAPVQLDEESLKLVMMPELTEEEANAAILAKDGIPVIVRKDIENQINLLMLAQIPRDHLNTAPAQNKMRMRQMMFDRILSSKVADLIMPDLLADAKAAGFDCNEADMKKLEDDYAASHSPGDSSPATFKDFVAAQQNPDKVLEEFKTRLTVGKYLEKTIGDKLGPVPSNEVERVFKDVAANAEGLDEAAGLAKIESIKKEIDAGADFAELAKKHSDCPSKAKGGDLGEFDNSRMVPEFGSVAFTAEVGAVSSPVKTRFGWHLIKVTDKIPAIPATDKNPGKPEMVKASHILVKTHPRLPTLEEVRTEMTRRRDAIEMNKYITKYAREHGLTMPAIDAAREKLKLQMERQAAEKAQAEKAEAAKAKPAAAPAAKPEAKPAEKPAAKPAAEPETKPQANPAAKPSAPAKPVAMIESAPVKIERKGPDSKPVAVPVEVPAAK